MTDIEADLFNILARCLVAVTAVIGQHEAPLQEPAAERMVYRSNPDAKEHEFDAAQGRKRRQFENVVGPAERAAHIVRDDARSGNDEYVRAANCVQALDPMNQLERYPVKSDSEYPCEATP